MPLLAVAILASLKVAIKRRLLAAALFVVAVVAVMGLYLAWIALAFVISVWFTCLLRYRFATGVDNLMIVIGAVYLAQFLKEPSANR